MQLQFDPVLPHECYSTYGHNGRYKHVQYNHSRSKIPSFYVDLISIINLRQGVRIKPVYWNTGGTVDVPNTVKFPILHTAITIH